MDRRMKYYYCELCGNVLEVIEDAKVVPVCCAQVMKTIDVNSDDTASKEKHVPVVSKEGFITNVKVGSTPHPMSKEHQIEWIEVETDKGVYRKYLEPGDKPEAEFIINEKETILKVYAYCNIHGLWVC